MNYLANLNWPILTLRLRGGNSEIYRAGIWPNERMRSGLLFLAIQKKRRVRPQLAAREASICIRPQIAPGASVGKLFCGLLKINHCDRAPSVQGSGSGFTRRATP